MAKKVVRVGSDAKDTGGATTGGADAGPTWTPTPEAKGKATKLRLVAGGLWALAIGAEGYGIFGLLRQDPVKMGLLIGLIVVIGLLAVGGSLLWKKANRLDPASKADTVRFFVQNQLGAIITVIAFLPLIVLILMNKDMSPKQKALAGGLGAIVMIAAAAVGVDWDSPSVEQYTEETNQVEDIVGDNLVYWTEAGKVFHLCPEVSDLQRESKDNKIYSGTVAEAHEAGKSRLTKEIAYESRICGFDDPSDGPTDAPAEDAPAEDAS